MERSSLPAGLCPSRPNHSPRGTLFSSGGRFLVSGSSGKRFRSVIVSRGSASTGAGKRFRPLVELVESRGLSPSLLVFVRTYILTHRGAVQRIENCYYRVSHESDCVGSRVRGEPTRRNPSSPLPSGGRRINFSTVDALPLAPVNDTPFPPRIPPFVVVFSGREAAVVLFVLQRAPRGPQGPFD